MAIYMKKDVVGPTGHINECWRSIRGEIDIVNEKGVIVFVGYKDGQSFADGKQSADNRVVPIDLTDMPEWLALYVAVFDRVAAAEGEFNGATMATVPEPTPISSSSASSSSSSGSSAPVV